MKIINYALCFIENQEGKFLLQLRDNKPNILFPGHWGLFGGRLEGRENYEQGLLREVEEEIGLILNKNSLKFMFDNSFLNRVGKVFHVKLNLDLDKIKKDQTEGQDAVLFTKEELINLKEPAIPEIRMFQEILKKELISL